MTVKLSVWPFMRGGVLKWACSTDDEEVGDRINIVRGSRQEALNAAGRMIVAGQENLDDVRALRFDVQDVLDREGP